MTLRFFENLSFNIFLFTGSGRGLASCLAIDCLYSLNGGRPGFALRKCMQVKIIFSPEYPWGVNGGIFSPEYPFGGERGNFFGSSHQSIFSWENGGKSILNFYIFIFILVISNQTLQNFRP